MAASAQGKRPAPTADSAPFYGIQPYAASAFISL